LETIVHEKEPNGIKQRNKLQTSRDAEPKLYDDDNDYSAVI